MARHDYRDPTTGKFGKAGSSLPYGSKDFPRVVEESSVRKGKAVPEFLSKHPGNAELSLISQNRDKGDDTDSTETLVYERIPGPWIVSTHTDDDGVLVTERRRLNKASDIEASESLVPILDIDGQAIPGRFLSVKVIKAALDSSVLLAYEVETTREIPGNSLTGRQVDPNAYGTITEQSSTLVASGTGTVPDSGFGIVSSSVSPISKTVSRKTSSKIIDTDAEGNPIWPTLYSRHIDPTTGIVVNEQYDVVAKDAGIAGIVESDQLGHIALTDPGSGYTGLPLVHITGGGTGGATPSHPATAHAETAEGKTITSIDSVTITAGGTGFTSPPTVTFPAPDITTPGKFRLAHGTAVLSGDAGTVSAITLNAGYSGYTSAPGVQIDPSPTGNEADNATAVSSIGPLGITGLQIVSTGKEYTSAPTATIDPPSDDEGVPYPDGVQATAEVAFALPATTGTLDFTLMSGGAGYTSNASVLIDNSYGDNTGAGANVGLVIEDVTDPDTGITTQGVITGFTNVVAGLNYAADPSCTVIDPGDPVDGASITAVLGSTYVEDVVIPALANQNFSSVPVLTFSNPQVGTDKAWLKLHLSDRSILSVGGGARITLEKNAFVGSTSCHGIRWVKVEVNGKTGIVEAVKVSETASTESYRFDVVSSVGFKSTPSVKLHASWYINGPGTTSLAGPEQELGCVLDRGYLYYNPVDFYPGSGYTSAPSVTVSPSILPGGVTAILAGRPIVSISSLTGSFSMPVNPVVRVKPVDGSGYGATVSVTKVPESGGVPEHLTVALTNGGNGYRRPPDVTLYDGGGSGGVVVAHTNIVPPTMTIKLTNPGSGYTSRPDVVLSGGGGYGAQATAIVGSTIGIEVTNPGRGYTTAPEVTVDPPSDTEGIPVSATAIISTSSVASVVFTGTDGDSGLGYTSQSIPIQFTGGGGSGVTAIATPYFANISRIVIDDQGAGYITNPTVTLDAPTRGRTATAQAFLAGGYYEVQKLDKWRSIQICSKIDLHSLPKPESFKKSARQAFPAVLKDFYFFLQLEFGTTATKAGFMPIFDKQDPFDAAIECDVIRSYQMGPPTTFNAPDPFYQQSTDLTMVLNAGSWESPAWTTQKVQFPSCLHGPITPKFVVRSDLGSGVSYGTFKCNSLAELAEIGLSKFGNLWFRDGIRFWPETSPLIPATTPAKLVTGEKFNLGGQPEKWRLGLWVIDTVTGTIPTMPT
jgi:hypothetical protein